jgi:membrane-associated HD superfamily phosphohydrolase
MMKSLATILKEMMLFLLYENNWHQNDSTELPLLYMYMVIRIFSLVILFSVEHFLKRG